MHSIETPVTLGDTECSFSVLSVTAILEHSPGASNSTDMDEVVLVSPSKGIHRVLHFAMMYKLRDHGVTNAT